MRGVCGYVRCHGLPPIDTTPRIYFASHLYAPSYHPLVPSISPFHPSVSCIHQSQHMLSIHQPVSCIQNPSMIPTNLSSITPKINPSVRHSIKKVCEDVQFSITLLQPMVCSHNWRGRFSQVVATRWCTSFSWDMMK